MLRASRRVVAVTSTVIALAGSAVPVLAQTRGASHPSAATPVVKLQASNFFFCTYSSTPCSSSNTNFRTKIHAGTKVKWFYKDSECDGISLCPGHNVKLGSRSASKTVKTENAVVYSMVFRSVGTFSYFCTHHKSTGMTGKIVVTRR